MVWIHAVAEYAAGIYGDHLMNPTSPDKLRLMGRYMRLAEGQRVLDVGAGMCGPALLLARELGCRVTAVEPYEGFLEEARRRVEQAGLADRFEFVQAEGAATEIEPGTYDAAMCLGATWAWGGLAGTLDALSQAVHDLGHVAAGEPYKRHPDDSSPAAPHDLTLAQIIDVFEERRLAVKGLIRSSTDDWDTYTSVRNLGFLEWLHDHPDHPDVEQVRTWRRDHARSLAEPQIGWALVVGCRTPLIDGAAD